MFLAYSNFQINHIFLQFSKMHPTDLVRIFPNNLTQASLFLVLTFNKPQIKSHHQMQPL